MVDIFQRLAVKFTEHWERTPLDRPFVGTVRSAFQFAPRIRSINSKDQVITNGDQHDRRALPCI